MFRLVTISIACLAGALLARGANTNTHLQLTNVPVIVIEAKGTLGDERTAAVIRTDARTNGGVVTGSVRLHGATSRGYPKKSLRVALDAPVPWLGMRHSAHWVLNAAFVDRSLMRHKLSYDLFRSLAAPGMKRYSAASRFVELQLNGEYHGVYLLMERVDRALLELRKFDSNAPIHACIYKAEDHAANFTQPGHSGFEQREPDPMTKPYWQPLDAFNAFVSGASDQQFWDPTNGIASRLDLDNAIDFHLLVLFTSNFDGITKNFIIARDADAKSGPAKFFFVPWDYDGTFGRNWDASRMGADAWLSNGLFDRLHANATFRRNFATRWKRLRERQFSVATVHGLIDENVRTLGDAAERNATRWKTLDGPYPDRLTFSEDIAQMKAWVTARVEWLDAEIARRAQ